MEHPPLLYFPQFLLFLLFFLLGFLPYSYPPLDNFFTISGYLQEELGRIPEDEEKPIIETKTVTYKIEQYEDKRIIKIKACKNNNEIIEEQKE